MKFIGTADSGAVFSDCMTYRYALLRRLNKTIGLLEPRPCLFVMLNPSTANHEDDDPTIRRCKGFAERWNFGCLTVVNLFALRSTDPKKLYKYPDPVGPDNDKLIIESAKAAGHIVCAWGTHGALHGRGRKVLRMLEEFKPVHLGLTKAGHPKHPLYLKSTTAPQVFE